MPAAGRGRRMSPVLLPLAARGAALLFALPAQPGDRPDALGLTPLAQPALIDWDMGRWRGRTLSDVTVGEPQAVSVWLADPRSAPHGGESLLAFIQRIGGWLDTRPVEEHG